MDDPSGTNQALIEENAELRRRIQELERPEARQAAAGEGAWDSDLLYRTIFETSGTAMVIIEEDATLSRVNDGWVKMTGYSREEVENKKKWPEFNHKDDTEWMLAQHRLRREDPDLARKDYEFRLITRDGEIRNIILKINMIPGSRKSVASLMDITERKRAEQELRKLASIVTHSGELVNLTSADGKMLFLNEAGCRMLGIEPGRVGEFRIEDVIPGRLHEKLRSEVMPALMKDGAWEGELQYLNVRNGKIMDMQSTTFAVRDPGNRALLYLANVSRDITEHKRAVEALKENEALLKGINTHIPGVVFRFYAKDSGEYGVSYMSKGVTGLLGLPVPDELDMLFPLMLSHVHPEDRDRFLSSIREAVAGAAPWDFEGRGLRPSGEEVWFHGFSTPTRQEDRLIFDGILLDVTQRRRAEEMSRQSEEKFTNIFMMAPDSIMISRLEDGMLIDANLGFEQITGWERSEAIGTTPDKSGFWQDVSERDYMVRELKSGRDVLGREFQFVRRDGSPRAGRYSARSINIAGEKCLILILQDITEKKRLEEMHGQLEQQLFQSHKMEAIGTLAGGIAHDFNNILSSIMGYSELILNESADRQRVNKYTEHVLQAAFRAKDLVKQILTFSQKAEPEKRPVTVTPIIKEVVKFMRASLPTTIAIRQSLDSTADAIMADPTQIHQVLMNLCTNAGHAMKETGGVLEIGLKEVSLHEEGFALESALKTGRYLKLSVRDTGHGISRENIGRIFEPYFTTKKKGEGTGLGLAVVHGIVKDHGGEISVDSEQGRGATFTIYLPVIEDEAEHATLAAKAAPAPGRGEKVLFIDDEEMVAAMMRELLGELGYTVVVETDPVRAAELFKRKSADFDVVITDRTMPRMTGYELVKRIRSIRRDIPVILCSGLQDREDAEAMKGLGIDRFLLKPVEMGVMAEAIREVLDKK